MSTQARLSGHVSFGQFELNLETAELSSNGSKTVLPGQPFQVLVTLLGRPGQLVTREELKRQLWPADTFVDFDVSLNKAVNRLREALGDSAEHPLFIETLPRKGYRFVGSVKNGTVAGVRSSATSSLATSLPSGPPDLPVRTRSGEISLGGPARSSGVGQIFVAAITLMAIAVTVVAVVMRVRVTRSSDLPAFRIRKLTDSGLAHDVAVSPDGRYIVYSLRAGDGESLRLRQVDTASDIEIVSSGPGFHGLTFTPDGVYVYFVRSDPKNPYFKYLYSVPALGGSARRMIADVDSPVSFSPDGSQFVFERAVPARNVIELRVANAEARGEHVLATIQNGDAGLFQPGPSWSRDGRSVICPFHILAPEGRWILVAVSVSDGAVRELYSDLAAFGRPVWLSAQKLLVPLYDSEYARWQLWTISYPDGKAQRFTNDLSNYDEPLDIARDRNVVVAVASSVVSNVWEAPAENLSAARQLTFGELPMLNIAASIDGRLFSSGGDGKIWEVGFDGHRQALTDVHHAGWMEICHGLIFFTSFEGKAVTLNRVSEDGSYLLTLFSGDVTYPGCSADGKFAYFVNRHRPQRIWRISADGGTPTPIDTSMGEAVSSSLSVSPDGTLLACTYIQYGQRAWRMAVFPANGGPVTKTFDVPGGTNRVRWSWTGTSLQYLLTHDGATNIWEQSVTGGEATQLTRFNLGRIVDFNWSLDHSKLFFVRGDVTSDVVLLTNVR